MGDRLIEGKVMVDHIRGAMAGRACLCTVRSRSRLWMWMDGYGFPIMQCTSSEGDPQLGPGREERGDALKALSDMSDVAYLCTSVPLYLSSSC